ncbi:4Fe-4S dicluster domain-containing protein [Thermoleophilum album]|uniref:electron transfer flavoprotein-ubiquinone oxidoreductase n=1 Tax=Thermoleophilum album TaxID=29539 RepID=UPI00237C82E3|nr:electron-transfer flavoprotein:ubiquinone oxidoreductase [Thermoleophilum album]WDT94085.1 4Fe-4S dicluster domain-containing protein [Thermoleophilum album]
MASAPAEFPPKVDPAKEFVGPPTDSPDERIEVGVAIVGGGPAGLSCAIRLGQLLAEDEKLLESLGEVPIAIIEKGKTCGSHLLSGAMMRPTAMRRLFPDLPESEWPTYGPVDKDAVYLLTPKRALPLKPTPPPFRNHGNHVTSVAQLGRWLAEKAEELGAYILPETAAVKLLVEDGQVVGVRTGDKGRDREGKELSNFEPGSDVVAKATVLCEGTQGHLAGAAIRYFGLGSDDPQQWELGVKEVWEVKQPLDRVIHTMGWPLRYRAKFGEFGGSFIYPMGEDKVSLGFVAGLDYKDATFSVHDTLQLLKTHPLVRGIIEGGKRIAWGAKTIPSGGYWAMPKRLWAPGMCITGDSAGMVNVPRLKGIHYAMLSGILAAEAIYEALKQSGSARDLSGYERRVRESEIEKDLYEVRNMRQPFTKGFFIGGAISNAMLITKGRIPGGHWETHDDATVPVFIGDRDKVYPKPDNQLTFNKLDSVFLSGNATRDDAPNHIRIANPVPLEVALMWQNMCPAQVYEVPEEELEAARVDGKLDGKKLVNVKVTPSNCVQCGAITAKGGRLTPPEGGDGPNYQVT